jgi:hypothetical protein
MCSILAPSRISVPSVTVPELVIKEPSRDPIRAVFRRCGEAPIEACVWVAGLGNACHRLVLGLLDYIAPVVWGLPLAILLEVALIGR